MSSFAQHCSESLRIFGKDYAQVHRWLDEFAFQSPHGMKHRCKRHHLAGIEEVRRQWDDEAAAATRQHIVMDLMQEGWTENDPFPLDEKHYRKMGLF